MQHSFTIYGEEFTKATEAVLYAAAACRSRKIRKYYVMVEGKRYPPNKLVQKMTALPASKIRTGQSLSILKRLGFTPKHKKQKK